MELYDKIIDKLNCVMKLIINTAVYGDGSLMNGGLGALWNDGNIGMSGMLGQGEC